MPRIMIDGDAYTVSPTISDAKAKRQAYDRGFDSLDDGVNVCPYGDNWLASYWHEGRQDAEICKQEEKQ